MNYDEKELMEYAELIVRCGVNLQAGQNLVIRNAPVTRPAVVEAIATQAYRAGSPLVTVLWSSDSLVKARLRNAPADSFDHHPRWLSDGMTTAARSGDAASSPDAIRCCNASSAAR